MPYDPQRGRPRPEPAADASAPVDALLGDEPDDERPTSSRRGDEATSLPEGVDVEVTDGGEVVIETAEAEIEVTALGDDVKVNTADATVEVRTDDDAVLVSAGDEEVAIDTSPRRGVDLEDELDAVLGAHVAEADAGRRARLIATTAIAAILALLAVMALRRRRLD